MSGDDPKDKPRDLAALKQRVLEQLPLDPSAEPAPKPESTNARYQQLKTQGGRLVSARRRRSLSQQRTLARLEQIGIDLNSHPHSPPRSPTSPRSSSAPRSPTRSPRRRSAPGAAATTRTKASSPSPTRPASPTPPMARAGPLGCPTASTPASSSPGSSPRPSPPAHPSSASSPTSPVGSATLSTSSRAAATPAPSLASETP